MSTSTSPKTTKATVEQVVEAITAATTPVALDLETAGLDPRRDEIRLAQILVDEKIFVVDLFKIKRPRVLFKALAEATVVLAHGAAFEYGFIYQKFGIALDNLVDTLLLSRLTACGDMMVDCSLGAVAERELELELNKAMQTSDWSSPVLTREQLDYAAWDVKVLPPLYAKLKAAVTESGQQDVAEIELAALPAVARMRLAGLSVDKKAWDAHAACLAKELEDLKREILDAEWLPEREPVPQTWALQGEDCLAMLRAAGLEVSGTDAKTLKDHTENELVATLLAYRKAKGDERKKLKTKILALAPEKPDAPAPPWNFGSWQQVGEIAEKILGFTPHSTNETTLLRYANRHPFFRKLLDYRKLAKRASTYGPEWFKNAYDEETGRVYPNWQQIGTSTGRFSCSSPNAQNIPSDGPYRSFFKAPPGRTFVDMDYSQIEVRVYAKIVEEAALLEIFERDDTDVYRATAANMLGVEAHEVSDEERQKAKAIVLGILYGLSAAGLPAYAFKSYGVVIEPDEAEDLIEKFFELYPNIAEDHARALEELEEDGYVDRKTLTGRRRDGITVRNEAINMPIQGTAADGLKLSIAKVYKGLKRFNGTAFIVGAFHDELLVECDKETAGEVATIVKKAMIEAMDEILNAEDPKVHIQVDVNVDKHWTKG